MESFYFFSKPNILYPELLLVEGHLADGGGPAAVGARSVAERLLVSHILGTQLVVFVPQLLVLLPLMLILLTSPRSSY